MILCHRVFDIFCCIYYVMPEVSEFLNNLTLLFLYRLGYTKKEKSMSQDKELTGTQIVGGLVGGAVGNVKGTAVGGAAMWAAIPVLGPFALLLPVVGAIIGTAAGATVGSKGLSSATILVLGAAPTDSDGFGVKK